MKTTRRTVIQGTIGALVAGEMALEGQAAPAASAAEAPPPEDGAPTPGAVTSSAPLTHPEYPWYMGSELLITLAGNQGKPIPFDQATNLLKQAAPIANLASLVPVLGRPPVFRKQPAPPEETAVPPTTLRSSYTPASVSVNAAVNSFYLAISRGDARLTLPNGLTIASVMPNWITSSAQAWHFGPGGVAEGAPDGLYPFLNVPKARVIRDCPQQKDVIVAVLDTAPESPGALESAIAIYQKSGMQVSAHLQALNHMMTQWVDFAGTTVPAAPPLASRATRDHGIFVASIVNRVAPKAQIHLLRVLDDSGGGQTNDILHALNYCLGLARSNQFRVVVNMSLYLLIPPDDAPGKYALKHYWNGSAPLDTAVVQAVQDLWAAGAVVIAAAGNDAMGYAKLMHQNKPIHTDLRRPGDYDVVLGVVATNRHGKLALYSNTDTDNPRQPQVIATWGGEAVGQEPNLLVPGVPNTRPRDGIVGAFLGPTWNRAAMPPGYDLPSASGWAYWSGTSFATPIISGIAANVLLANPCLTPPEVVEQVFALAKPAVDPKIRHRYIGVGQ